MLNASTTDSAHHTNQFCGGGYLVHNELVKQPTWLQTLSVADKESMRLVAERLLLHYLPPKKVQAHQGFKGNQKTFRKSTSEQPANM